MSMETPVAQDGRPIRVAIDDDYPIVVQGLAAMLADHADRVEIVDLGPKHTVSAEVVLKDAFAMTDDVAEYVAKTRGRALIFADRKSTRLNSSHVENLVCRLLREKKKIEVVFCCP